MKTKNTSILIMLGIALISCNQSSKKAAVTTDVNNKKEHEIISTIASDDNGYTLLKNNCYVCHNPKAASHDDIIAPPFMAVKMHYTREYDNKKDFVNAVVSWVQNPTEDKALMFGAVKRFKVMPKLPLPTEDLEKIASYLYDNEVEKPTWMDAHMKEMQGKGMMGKGMKNNN